MTKTAHANNVKVLISIGGATTQGPPLSSYLDTIFAYPSSSAIFIDSILSMIQFYNLDGVDMDIEGTCQTNAYSNFMLQLEDSLKNHNLLFSAAAGSWTPTPESNSAWNAPDWIDLMAYDSTGTWTPPGPTSSVYYAQYLLNEFLNAGTWLGYTVPKSHVGLGLPFYGYFWANGSQNNSGSFDYDQLIKMYPNANNMDGFTSGDTVFSYNGQATIKTKTQMALQQASGIMIWTVSYDTTGKKSLMGAASNALINAIQASMDTTPNNIVNMYIASLNQQLNADSAVITSLNSANTGLTNTVGTLTDSIVKLNDTIANYMSLVVMDTINVLTINDATNVFQIQQTSVTVSLFPNPSGKVVNLSSTSDIQSYALYDMNGNLILSNSSVGELQTTSINLNGLAGGVYVLKVITDVGPFDEKLLIVNGL